MDRAWIEAHIPHRAACACSTGPRLECRTNPLPQRRSPRADHPLRAHGRLGAACGIEFAAQAMAVHGALPPRDDPTPRRPPAFSRASRRRLHVARLDDVKTDLICDAVRMAGDRGSSVSIRTAFGRRCMLSGRAAVVLDAELPAGPHEQTGDASMVTGGSGGIGAAICRRLGAAGTFRLRHAHAAAPPREARGARHRRRRRPGAGRRLRRHRRRGHARGPRGDAGALAPSRFWSTMPASTTMRSFPA